MDRAKSVEQRQPLQSISPAGFASCRGLLGPTSKLSESQRKTGATPPGVAASIRARTHAPMALPPKLLRLCIGVALASALAGQGSRTAPMYTRDRKEPLGDDM